MPKRPPPPPQFPRGRQLPRTLKETYAEALRGAETTFRETQAAALLKIAFRKTHDDAPGRQRADLTRAPLIKRNRAIHQMNIQVGLPDQLTCPLNAFLLNRIGVQFVTRGNRAGSRRDVLRVLRSAAGGGSLAFFPEGTFEPQPGLLRFHTGAFAAAERAGAPVVPLVIRGTRRCLPPGSFLPHPGLIEVATLPAIEPRRGHPEGAALLRDAARAAILAALDEDEAAGAAA